MALNNATMSTSKLQTNRYELKYIIDEPRAHAIHRFVRAHLEPDSHTQGHEGRGYAVHSLYLDSPGFLTCAATLHGIKNRFKLRLRFYDDEPDSPVFCEIKRRVNMIILKKRAAVRRSAIPDLLAGAMPDPSMLYVDNYRNHDALLRFCELRDLIDAHPAAYTSYWREGYETAEGNAVRVTFDRELRGGIFHGSLSVADLESWAEPEVGGVVLELKFTDRFPQWMHTLAEMFALERTSMPKYVKCVALANPDARRVLAQSLASEPVTEHVPAVGATVSAGSRVVNNARPHHENRYLEDVSTSHPETAWTHADVALAWV
jgi:hypothetical protein